MKQLLFFACLFFSAVLNAQSPQLIVPAGHGDQVYLIKYSADGKYLFSVGTGAKGVKVWDTKTGNLLKNLAVENFPTCMQVSSDSKTLIVGTKYGIYFFEFPSFKLLRKLNHGAEDAVVGSNALYALSSGTVYTVDLKTFSEKQLFYPGSSELISLSPNGEDLFVVSTFSTSVFNISSGKIIRDIQNESGAAIIGYTPAGNIFSFNTSTNRKGDWVGVPALSIPETGKSLLNFNFKVPGSARLQSLKNQVVYGSNNQVCVAGYSTIITADYRTGKKSGEIKIPDGDIIALAAYDNMVVAGDKFKGTLKQYDITTGNLIRTYGEDVISPVVWETATNANGLVMDGIFDSPCGYFNSNANGKITAASFQNKENELMSMVGISADATITATYNQKEIQLYNAPAFDMPYLKFSIPDKQVAVLGISPDNKKLVVAYKNYIDVYDLLTGTLLKEIPISVSGNKLVKEEYLNETNNICSFSDDSRFVAVKADDMAVYDLQQYQSSGAFYTYSRVDIEALRLSADGKKLYYIKGKTYNEGLKWCEYDVNGSKPVTETALNFSLKKLQVSDDDVQKVNAAISPDLNLIAYVSNDEIGIYNRKTSNNNTFLKGHESYVRQVRWLANGMLVSSGNDNTIRFWDAVKGVELAKLVMFKNGGWVIVTPGGQFDASEDAMKKLYYVQGVTTISLDNLYEKFYAPNLLARILAKDAVPAPDVDVNILAAAPKVKMVFDIARNLVVADDVPKLDWTNETISIKVNAECTENAIDEIRLYLNGKLIDGTGRNLVVEDEGKKTLSKTFVITLAPGINSFKAIAFNKQRTESKPDETDVNYIPAKNVVIPVVNNPTLHLLVIGINNYKNPKYNLNYAKADATSFKEQMEQNGGGLFSKTKLYFITDAEAMKVNIENTFNKIISEAKPQDIFIFYYAGHGVMTTEASKEFYIVPYDVTQLYGAEDALAQKGISAKELQEFSKKIPAQKQLYILDACQSAGALDAVAMRGAAEEKAIAQLARSTGTHWLTASGSEQFATEFSQLGHGVFTYALLQGLAGGAANGDKQITINELKAYLEIQVPELSQKYKGTAQYPASYGLGNDFPVEIVK